LFIIPDASNPICHCLQQVLDEDAAARAALNDRATDTSVAVAGPSNPSFFTQQPGNLLLFATGNSSSRKIGLRRELTKSLSSDIVPNQQEILAMPTPKKKKKKKATPVLPLFQKATHSPVSPEYKIENISMNVSSTKLPGRELIDRSPWKMYADPWNGERLTMVKNAVRKNIWYTFFDDVSLDGDESHWGEGNSVFHYLMHCKILTLLASLHDLLPLAT
jgi:hypothetical protein